MRVFRSALLVVPFLASGCDFIQSRINVDIEGELEISGDRPAAFDLKLFNRDDNRDAFELGLCEEERLSNPCFGTLDVEKLENPVEVDAEVDEDTFTFSNVPIDVFYILVATGADETIACSTDVVGFEEDTKLITFNSTIRIDERSLTEVEVPRAVKLHCQAPLEEPTLPEEEEQIPEETGDTDDTGDIPASENPPASWSSVVITDASGTQLADASSGDVTADVRCGSSFPSVLVVRAEAADADQEEAFLRIQFGSGDAATFRTFPVPIVDGKIEQSISLTGGYAVVQLDFNEALDGDGESYVTRFCERGAPPAQEMLTILTWDKQDTDVDTHIYAQGSEVAYYSISQPWGDLDIDDIDGFGPETFTSRADVTGESYEVRVHYYSDHGNDETQATMRVVYYDDTTGQTCDITATRTLVHDEWWTVGAFGPGLACPN